MTDFNNVVSAFMKVFNEDKKCFRDEFNRPKSDIEYRFGSDDDDNYFVNELKNRIEGLNLVRINGNIATFSLDGCEVNVDYMLSRDPSVTILTFTKLSYIGDTRDFED